MGRRLFREGFLGLALLGLLVTTPLRGAWPRFSRDELEVLYLLFLLFTAVKAIERGGHFRALAGRLEAGQALGPKLVLGTFLLAALVTNDVALLATLPLVLALRNRRAELAVLLVLAANAGSALTPFGNPQNLYLYWYYRPGLGAFVTAILPLGAVFFALLGLAAWWLGPPPAPFGGKSPARGRLGLPLAALLVVIGAVLRVLPLPATLVALGLLLLADRGAFRAVDSGLFLTFAAFFLLVDNLEALVPLAFPHRFPVFALAVLLSQGLGNVPAAVFLAPFTPHWRTLLWGVNVGGFGTPIASIANLIAFRLFLGTAGRRDRRRFLFGYGLGETLALALGIALFLLFTP